MSSNAMPYQEAYSFLMAPTQRSGTTPFPDGYQWGVTLESLRNSDVWESALSRVRGKIDLADYKGQPCWVFVIAGGVGRGDRKTPVFYKVWLPTAHPSFPIRVETRSSQKNTPWIEFEVLEFSEPVVLDGTVKIRYPLKYLKTHGNAPGRNKNLPYSIHQVTVRKAQFNQTLAEDEFVIYPSEASRVINLDTGQTTNLGPKK